MGKFMKRTNANMVDLMSSASPEDAPKIGSERVAKGRVDNVNSVIFQVPRERIDQRLRCFGSLLES
jgi:hypothetical protein